MIKGACKSISYTTEGATAGWTSATQKLVA
jgi:hypothetical protein